MKFFLIVIGLILASVLAGPVGFGLLLIALFIQEQLYESKLTKQRELNRIEIEIATKELQNLKEQEALKKETAEAVERLKTAITAHERKKKLIKNAIQRDETTYMIGGKKHILVGEEFICIEDI